MAFGRSRRKRTGSRAPALENSEGGANGAFETRSRSVFAVCDVATAKDSRLTLVGSAAPSEAA